MGQKAENPAINVQFCSHRSLAMLLKYEELGLDGKELPDNVNSEMFWVYL